MKIKDVERGEILRKYHAAARREDKTAIIQEVAGRYGVHYSTVHRALKLSVRKKRQASDDLVGKRLAIEEWARQVFDFKLSKNKDDHKISIKKAFRWQQVYGNMPAWITLKMIYDAIESQNLVNLSKNETRRFEMEEPLQLVQADFMRSEYIKHVGNGILKITSDRYTRTKKQKEEDDVHLWAGGVVDDCSRVVYFEYFLSLGESTEMARTLLFNAMKRKESMLHLQGLPRKLYVDRGPGFREEGFKDGLKKLGIEVKLGGDKVDSRGRPIADTNKQAHGKIEVCNKIIKGDFETDLLLGLVEGCDFKEGTQISLADLNDLAWKWCEDYNQREHPTRPGMSRWNVFAPVLTAAAFPSKEDEALFGDTQLRTVNNNGMISVRPNVWCKAPVWAKPKDKVPVFFNGGKFFVYHEEQRYELELQMGTPERFRERFQINKPTGGKKLASNQDTDIIIGSKQREYFAEELERVSGGAYQMQDIPHEIWQEDILPWFKADHSLKEIKEQARMMKIRLDMLDAPQLAEETVSHPKVISSNAHYTRTVGSTDNQLIH